MEDQEIMEQFMENKQGYVIDNMNAVAGCGGMGVGEVMGSSEEILGVKYDEQLHEKNDVGDDDELKYVKEVQQSEKQQSMENVGDGRNTNELAEKEEEVDKYEVGMEEENVHNQKDFENMMHSIGNDNTNGHGDHNVSDQMNQVAEALSPTLAPAAGTEYVAYSSAEDYQEQYEMEKDEDSCSLTTNTTNGSSLSENLMQAVALVDENVSPLIAAAAADGQTTDLNIDHSVHHNDFEPMPSQLNPEAKEFVPTFESNILSPNSPGGMTSEDELEKAYFGQVPSAVPHRLMAEDDFVAQSPRKGRGDNMDTIFVPAVQEFEEEADQRPHELEADVEIMSVEETILNNDNKAYEDALGDIIVSQDSQLDINSDLIDNNAPLIMDHGPETFVDLDMDIETSEQPFMGLSEKDNDPMKQSIYVSNDEAIENVLNSVQPIPTEIDSVNNSFTEEVSAAAPVGDKELLQVEEKEHISKSPSTEEIHMNLPSSNNDVSQVLFDMKDASLMQGSFYADQSVQQCTDNCPEENVFSAIVDNNSFLETADKREQTQDLSILNSEEEQPNLLETSDTQNDLYATYSSSADEKHLMEDTKELQENLHKSSVEHLMSEMAINDNGTHPQVDEKCTAPDAAINNDESNNSNSSESFVNKCEQFMVIDENTSDFNNEFIQHSPNQVEHTEVGGIASQHISKGNADDLTQIEEHSTDNKNASLFTNEKEMNNICEDVTPVEEVVMHGITVSDFINISEQFELSNQKEIGGTDIFGLKQLSCGDASKEQDDMAEHKVANIEKCSYGNEGEGQNNICDEIVPSLGGATIPEPLSKTIVNEDVAENVVEKVTTAVCSTAPVKASLPVEASSINTIKKPIAKNTSSALKAKTTTSSLSSSSKKTSTTEVAKKPIGVVTKPKLPAVKPSAVSASSDRKPIKPPSVAAPTARKPLVPATTAPKIPLKGNVPSRTTQITTTITKTTTSRPVAATRTITSALATARKPAAPVSNSTTKARPASSSAVPAKTSTLGSTGVSTSKPKAVSPRATLTSQMRKPGPSTTTVKSPVKSTIPSSVSKPASSSLGTRPKPASAATSSTGSAAMKTTTARPAPKVSSCSTTTTRRLTVGGSTSGTAAPNTATKATAATTARKSSPIKPASGRTPTKPITSTTNSNAKCVIKPPSPKATENKLNGKSEMNGGATSDKAIDLNLINGSSQDASFTGDHQQSFLANEDLNKPPTNDINLTPSEDIKRGVTEPLQEDLIGAYDH